MKNSIAIQQIFNRGLRALMAAMILSTMSACTFRELKQEVTAVPEAKPGFIDFQTVYRSVLQPHCVECHGTKGGVNLESYASVIRDLERVRLEVEGAEMPPSPLPRLSEAAQKLVLQWIDDGAPEVLGASNSNRPVTPPASTLTPTYHSLEENIFRPRCQSCHSPGGKAKFLPLMNWSEVTSTDEELLDLAHPERSKLIDVVTTEDTDDLMPPPRSGKPRLSTEEVQAILDWIAQGAKDN